MELKDLGLQRINLDLSNDITGNFFAKEGDVGTRGLSIKVLNNSVEIDTTGVSITMYARVGQEVYSVDATVKDVLKGEYELIYPTSILKSGIVYAELQLKKLTNIISTKKFKILVESGIVTDSAIEGHDSYPIFEQLLEAGANEITRIANEEIRKLNEIARDDAESLRGVRLGKVEEDLTAHKEDYVRSKDLPHFNHAKQEYVNLDKFWDNLRDGKIYTVEFNQFEVSPSPIGVKKDDNKGLAMEPSTNTIRGRDDYSSIGLFKPIEVNAYVDENDDYHVIAIQGDGRFKRDGTMGDVYIMNMVGYTKYVTDDLKWSISYSDSMHAGFEVIQEAIKPDGTIRPYLLHAKYVAGRNPYENNNLASISGVYAEYVNMSHNGQITEFKTKGAQYSGKTSHDDFWVQLLMWLKYATTNSQSIMKGCESYYVQYTPSILETDVKRFIVTNAQSNNFLVGSAVSIGDFGAGSINADRNLPQNFNVVNRGKILAIETLEDGLNTAVVLDTSITFSTTQTTTIATYPWNSGGCDKVLGTDGSPYNNQSGKEPFIIGGIEMMVGGYEVLQNLIILNNAVDNRIDVYANYDCKTYATSITSDYDLAGQLAQTNNVWKYGSKMVMPSLHPSIILVTEAEASSTTGNGDGIYTNPPSVGGTRVWLSLGSLSLGALIGLRCLSARDSLAGASWPFLGRLSATGRSQRRS